MLESILLSDFKEKKMDQSEYKKLKSLIEPVQTPEELNNFIIENWNIELPWDMVDEKSTSSSLKFLWHVYKYMLTGIGPDRHVVAAARNSAKTLTSAMVQYFSLVHFRRNSLHLAATVDQSYALIQYIDKFLRDPVLAPYTNTDNVRQKMLQLPPNDFTTQPYAKLQVATATKKGTNSQRASCFDGKTKVLVYRTTPRKDSTKGNYVYFSMNGIYKKIQKGEEIYAVSINNYTGKIEKNKITRSFRQVKTSRLKIKTKSGKEIRCTPDHLLAYDYDSEIKYKRADQFNVGDSLFSKKRGFIVLDEIVSITPYDVPENSRDRYVYDITVENNHNFFADLVLAHNCLSFDEVDLTPPEILTESAYIADPSLVYKKDGTVEKRDPIFIYLSSRKTNSGPLQELIDEAEMANNDKTIYLHKWSMVDWMEKCPDNIRKEIDGDPFKAYINSDNLETIWSEEKFLDRVPEISRTAYIERDAFEGCRTCKAWVACQGRSVKQRSKSFMLRSVKFISIVLSSVKESSAIIAQALNWKPETKGIVFKDFNYHKHVKGYIDFYTWVTFGQRFNPTRMPIDKYDRISSELDNCTYAELQSITPTKKDIYNAMVEYGWTMIAGVDWGYDPDPAACVVMGYHVKKQKCAILHTEAQNGYSNHAWAEYCCKNIFNQFPVEFVAPDQADPSSVTYFKPYGVSSLGRKKKPKKIITGVAFIRSLLWNPQRGTYDLCILDDSYDILGSNLISAQNGGNAIVIHELMHWTHAKDPLGRWKMDKFDENNNNHACFTEDALVETEDGFKKISDIQIGDRVLTHTGRYQRVSGVMSREYNGDIIDITPFGREKISCTPEHPFLVQDYKRSYCGKKSGQLDISGDEYWVAADLLHKTEKNAKSKKSLIYKKPIKTENYINNIVLNNGEIKTPRNKKHIYTQNIPINKNLSFLLGYYLAEGSSSFGKTQRNVSFAMHKLEMEFSTKQISEFINSIYTGYKPKIFKKTDGNGARLYINSTPIWEIFKEFGSKTEKKLPNWCLNLNNDMLKYLLIGYLYGDGTFRSSYIISNSISRVASYQLLKISIKLGLSVRIKKRYREGRWDKKYNIKDQWVLNFSRESSIQVKKWIGEDPVLSEILNIKHVYNFQEGNMPSFKIKNYDDKINFLIRDKQYRAFSGTVYNLEVENDHSYTVNGVVVSNCDAMRYALHPFTMQQSVKVSVSSDKYSGNLQNRILKGDTDAEIIAKQKSELKNQFNEYMNIEHGVKDVFKPASEVYKEQEKIHNKLKNQKEDIADDKSAENKRTSGIKFVF